MSQLVNMGGHFSRRTVFFSHKNELNENPTRFSLEACSIQLEITYEDASELFSLMKLAANQLEY